MTAWMSDRLHRPDVASLAPLPVVPLLQPIADGLWHVQHAFTTKGIAASSRMTIVRLANGALWLHSPVAMSQQLRAEVAALGEVGYLVAPNKLHHLFLADAAAAFPQARLFGAPGLSKKRPDISGLRTLSDETELAWRNDFDQLVVRGFPLAHEVVWFHRPSRTLILTDLCQSWQGPLPFTAALYSSLTGVRNRLAVPRSVRLLIKDKRAFTACARAMLQWPFERVIMAHNSIVDNDAHAAVTRAFSFLDA